MSTREVGIPCRSKSAKVVLGNVFCPIRDLVHTRDCRLWLYCMLRDPNEVAVATRYREALRGEGSMREDASGKDSESARPDKLSLM